MWRITDTVYSDRKNWFSMKPGEEFHVATIVSGSSEKLDRFQIELATLVYAPEMRQKLALVAARLRVNPLRLEENSDLLFQIDELLSKIEVLEAS